MNNKNSDYNMVERVAFFIATFSGLGLVKFAPGTIGSLGAMVISVLLQMFNVPPMVQLYLAAVTFVLGWFSCIILKRKDKVQDPGYIVIDEVSAIFLINFVVFSFIGDSTYFNQYLWLLGLAGFAIFRVFDIMKPSLIGYFDERLKNSFGVMFDDLLASLVTIVIMVMGLFAWSFFIS